MTYKLTTKNNRQFLIDIFCIGSKFIGEEDTKKEQEALNDISHLKDYLFLPTAKDTYEQEVIDLLEKRHWNIAKNINTAQDVLDFIYNKTTKKNGAYQYVPYDRLVVVDIQNEDIASYFTGTHI